jgi:hypothetical protein
MRFARVVFTLAGIWGLVVLAPLFFLVDISGRPYAAPTEYPHFFYGFVSVALAWQIAFLIIGRDPARFRPLMIPAIFEKLGYVAILAVLWARGTIGGIDAQAAVPDAILGLLFAVAFVRTPTRRS